MNSFLCQPLCILFIQLTCATTALNCVLAYMYVYHMHNTEETITVYHGTISTSESSAAAAAAAAAIC